MIDFPDLASLVPAVVPGVISIYELLSNRDKQTTSTLTIKVILVAACTVIACAVIYSSSNELKDNFRSLRQKSDSIKSLQQLVTVETGNRIIGQNGVPCMMYSVNDQRFYFINRGTDPAYDLSGGIEIDQKKQSSFHLGTLPVNTNFSGPTYSVAGKDSVFVFVNYTTRKGYLFEILLLKLQEGRWYQAYQITDISSSVRYTYVEPNFPLDPMTKGWMGHRPIEKLGKTIVTDDSVYHED
jgi:hypothetical protein